MENSKKRKLSGTVLAGTFAVPAALHAAQQNITSANSFTDLCSSASSFFTKKAGESTFSFLASRIVTCFGVAFVVLGLYGLYKYLSSSEKEESGSKEENIENNEIKEEENNLDKFKDINAAHEILRSVWQEKERYIKEVIEEFIEQRQIKNKKEKEKLVNIIFKQLVVDKIKEEDFDVNSMVQKSEERAQQKAVGIVKGKIKETYGEEINKLIKENTMATKIQAVYKLYRIKRQIDNVYEKNKEFLDNFKISEDLALSFGITFDKDVEKNENNGNNGNRVDVSVKKENYTIKVTFKRGKEEKTLGIEKSEGGLRSLEELVRLSKQDLKYKINYLYTVSNNERFLKEFEIDEKNAGAFVQFEEKNKENKGKVSVTTKKEDEKITFTFKNENEEKTLEIPVTKEGYTKLEKLIELAKDYDNKNAKKENEENDLDPNIINNEDIKKEKGKVQENKEKVEDENFEKFKKFKRTFKSSFGVVKKNDPYKYLTLTESNDNSIALKYTSNMRYEYPLSISYDSSKRKFKLHYEWTGWWGKRTYYNDELESVEEATKWFLKKFKEMYDYTTRGNLTYEYDEDNILRSFYDGKQLVDVTTSNSDIEV